MQLQHRFEEEDKARVWVYHPYCAVCQSNQNCSLHHCYGCKEKYTDSICNAVMLCERHHREADGHNIHTTGDPFRINLLGIALRQIAKVGYEFKERDKMFLLSVYEDVKKVLQ